jgi:hypothetical protein
MSKNETNHTWIKALALAALLVGIGKCLRFRAWRMAGDQEGEQWPGFPGPGGVLAAKRWHKLHGHRPPWVHESSEPDGEASEPAGPAAASGAAEAPA